MLLHIFYSSVLSYDSFITTAAVAVRRLDHFRLELQLKARAGCGGFAPHLLEWRGHHGICQLGTILWSIGRQSGDGFSDLCVAANLVRETRPAHQLT